MQCNAKLYCALGDAQIDQVLNNCAIIFTSADIFKFVDIWHLSVAKEIIFTFRQVFGDVDVTESEEPENKNTLSVLMRISLTLKLKTLSLLTSQMMISILLKIVS